MWCKRSREGSDPAVFTQVALHQPTTEIHQQVLKDLFTPIMQLCRQKPTWIFNQVMYHSKTILVWKQVRYRVLLGAATGKFNFINLINLSWKNCRCLIWIFVRGRGLRLLILLGKLIKDLSTVLNLFRRNQEIWLFLVLFQRKIDLKWLKLRILWLTNAPKKIIMAKWIQEPSSLLLQLEVTPNIPAM